MTGLTILYKYEKRKKLTVELLKEKKSNAHKYKGLERHNTPRVKLYVLQSF